MSKLAMIRRVQTEAYAKGGNIYGSRDPQFLSAILPWVGRIIPALGGLFGGRGGGRGGGGGTPPRPLPSGRGGTPPISGGGGRGGGIGDIIGGILGGGAAGAAGGAIGAIASGGAGGGYRRRRGRGITATELRGFRKVSSLLHREGMVSRGSRGRRKRC